MNPALLILNAGSSILKFAVYETAPTGELQAAYRGLIEEIVRDGRFKLFHTP